MSYCDIAPGHPLHGPYHDREYGFPLAGDDALFERLVLEINQAGLSWLTILKKREAFREAFRGFELARVARFGERDRQRLLADEGIIRNRLKVDATISNARVTQGLVREHPGALDELIWGFAPARRDRPPASLAELPAVTAESTALSAALKKVGYRFVGPTTIYALMQSGGLVDDHVAGCFRSSFA